MPFYIVGDIAATNSQLRIYKVLDSGDEHLVVQRTYKSQTYSCLWMLVNTFLTEESFDDEIKAGCFAVAGPVVKGVASMPKLGWTLVEEDIENELGIEKITLMNNIVASSYGIKLLGEGDLFTVSEGVLSSKDGFKLVVGIGTGLGNAVIFQRDDELIVMPGEGGHVDFAPTNKIEYDLLRFIKDKFNVSQVSVERVVSGTGLESIYWFFAKTNPKLVNEDVSNEIKAAEHPGKIISHYGTIKKDVLCEKALYFFIKCLGGEVGNLAATILPTRGIYLVGIIASELRDLLKKDFLDSFYTKGKLNKMMGKYPIYVVKDPDIAIIGARFMARKDYEIVKNTPEDEKPERKAFHANQERNTYYKLESQQRSKLFKKGNFTQNSLWMVAGIALSGFVLGAFIFGRRSK